jgi:hypothetical protein
MDTVSTTRGLSAVKRLESGCEWHTRAPVVTIVADIERAFVRTTAVWCTLGTAGRLVLVVLALLGSPGHVRRCW